MNLTRFQTPKTIYTGWGALSKLAEEVPSGARVLIVTDPGVQKAGLVDQVLNQLQPLGASVSVFAEVEPDPSVQTVQKVVDLIRAQDAAVVIGVGGGSSMDTCKVATGVADSGGTVKEWRGRTLPARNRKLIQIPTTSGTGSEATDRGILSDEHEKVGYLSPVLLADTVILDPNLTMTLPPFVTATTGMDALTHAVEAYTARGASALTDQLALGAIQRIGRHLRSAVLRGDDREARAEMALASLWAGIAFNNAGLGLVHALVLPVGAHFGVAHGLGCALLLPPVMEFNQTANLERFRDIAVALGEPVAGLSPSDAAAKSVSAVRRLMADIGMPAGLSAAGVKAELIPQMAQEGFGIKRLVNSNPRTSRVQDCEAILRAAM